MNLNGITSVKRNWLDLYLSLDYAIKIIYPFAHPGRV